MADLFDPSDPYFDGETFDKFIDDLFTGQRQLLPADPSLLIRLRKALKLFEKVLYWDIFTHLSSFIRIFHELECGTLTLSAAINKYQDNHKRGLHFYAQSATHVRCCEYYLDSLEEQFPDMFFTQRYYRCTSQMLTHEVQLIEAKPVDHHPICTATVDIVNFGDSDVLAKTNHAKVNLVLPMQTDMRNNAEVCENGERVVAGSLVASKPSNVTTAGSHHDFDTALSLNPDMLVTSEDLIKVQHFSANYPDCLTATTDIIDFCPVLSTVSHRKRRWYFGRHRQTVVKSHQAHFNNNLCFIRECHWCFSSVRAPYSPRKTQWFNLNLTRQPLLFGHCSVEGGGDNFL